MKRLLIFYAVIFLNVFGFVAHADSNQALMEIAAEHYKNGEFSQAEEVYIQVIETGYESPELYYNLGNTYYKLSDLPNSILYYEKAKMLSPKDEDIIFNLELARSHTVDRLEEIPEFFLASWFNSLSDILLSDTWAIISMILFALSLLFFLLFFISGSTIIKRLSFYTAIVILTGCIITFIFSWSITTRLQSGDSAIIFEPSVTIKSSPDDSGTDLFLLHEGTKVMLIDSVSEWYEIKLSDGNEGWIKSEYLEKI